MQIEFEIDGMRLTRTSEAYITEGSKNFIKLLFSFTSDWGNVQKWALFARDNQTYEIEIVDGACIVPYDAARTEGQFQLTVVGKDADNDIIATTGEKTVYVSSNEFDENPSGEETRLTNTFLVDTLAAVKEYAEQAATSESSAKTSESNAKTSEDNAKTSELAAAISQENASTSESNAKEYAENAKNSADVAETSAEEAKSSASASAESLVNAQACEANAKTSATSADLSEQNAKASESNANIYANNAAASATAASTSATNAAASESKAKEYSENVNVFIPSVSVAGVLSWTNKAGLDNPTSVNIKGDKGDKGEQGIQGLTGPKGDKGDAAIEVDSTLSTTSTNPVQNKVITNALAGKADASALASVAASGNYEDLTNRPIIVNVNSKNTWTDWQTLQFADLSTERYTSTIYSGTSHTPTTSDCIYTATGAFTLDMSMLAEKLNNSSSMVFSATFSADDDYTLTVSNAGTLKYLGDASDLAITSAGLLLNIKMCKDADGNVTSYLQGITIGA